MMTVREGNEEGCHTERRAELEIKKGLNKNSQEREREREREREQHKQTSDQTVFESFSQKESRRRLTKNSCTHTLPHFNSRKEQIRGYEGYHVW
jgi:hypothetical protein